MANKSGIIARMGIAVAATATLVGTLVVGGSPAHAANWQQAETICPNGSTCIWLDQNFLTSGRLNNYLSWQYFIPDFGAYNYRNTVTNAANSSSSMFNDGVWDETWLFGGTYRTSHYIYGPPKSYANFGAGHNDDFESGYFASCLDGVC